MRVGLVLGSGFSRIRAAVEHAVEIPYGAIPGCRPVSVDGHDGLLCCGLLGGVPVAVLCGRCHYYEGVGMSEVTRPVRVLAAMGVRTLLLTNAAGGIRRSLRVGDFMAISDHINAMGVNPLRGAAWPGLARFTDLTAVYDRDLRRSLARAARSLRIRLTEGVYLAVSGPSYETPAEVRAFRRWGADAVGMSTVPEALVARQHGMRVAGVSCITNKAAGLPGAGPELGHEEVLLAGMERGGDAVRLVADWVRRVGGK